MNYDKTLGYTFESHSRSSIHMLLRHQQALLSCQGTQYLPIEWAILISFQDREQLLLRLMQINMKNSLGFLFDR